MWTPAEIGLDPARYAAMRRYLFDRPVPCGQQQAWVWDADLLPFDATPLEWTRFQSVLFGNAGDDLADFDGEQVGMGLQYLMDARVGRVQ